VSIGCWCNDLENWTSHGEDTHPPSTKRVINLIFGNLGTPDRCRLNAQGAAGVQVNCAAMVLLAAMPAPGRGRDLVVPSLLVAFLDPGNWTPLRQARSTGGHRAPKKASRSSARGVAAAHFSKCQSSTGLFPRALVLFEIEGGPFWRRVALTLEISTLAKHKRGHSRLSGRQAPHTISSPPLAHFGPHLICLPITER